MITFLFSVIIFYSIFCSLLIIWNFRLRKRIRYVIWRNFKLNDEVIQHKNTIEFASKMLKYLLDNREKLDVFKEIYFAEMEVNGKYFVMTNKDGEFNIECFDYPWGSDPDDKIIN